MFAPLFVCLAITGHPGSPVLLGYKPPLHDIRRLVGDAMGIFSSLVAKAPESPRPHPKLFGNSVGVALQAARAL